MTTKTTKPSALETRIVGIVNDESLAKSEKMRQLLALGVSRGDVGRLLHVRYQFVRNVDVKNQARVAKAAHESEIVQSQAEFLAAPEEDADGDTDATAAE